MSSLEAVAFFVGVSSQKPNNETKTTKATGFFSPTRIPINSKSHFATPLLPCFNPPPSEHHLYETVINTIQTSKHKSLVYSTIMNNHTVSSSGSSVEDEENRGGMISEEPTKQTATKVSLRDFLRFQGLPEAQGFAAVGGVDWKEVTFFLSFGTHSKQNTYSF